MEQIENPLLTAAIDQYAHGPSEANRDELYREIASATYLVPIVADAAALSPADLDGEALIEAGRGFQTLVCEDPHTGDELLPIFSDGRALAAFTQQDVAVLVLELPQVHDLLASAQDYAGAVVNPAGTAVPMSSKMIAELARGTRGNGEELA